MSLRLPDNLIQIDIDPNAENRTYPSKVFHLGDGKKVLENLYERLDGIKNVDENWTHLMPTKKPKPPDPLDTEQDTYFDVDHEEQNR